MVSILAVFATAFAAALDVDTSSNAYCSSENVVSGLSDDGPAKALEQCFFTGLKATPAGGERIPVQAGTSIHDAYAKAQCGDTLLLGASPSFSHYSSHRFLCAHTRSRRFLGGERDTAVSV